MNEVTLGFILGSAVMFVLALMFPLWQDKRVVSISGGVQCIGVKESD